MKKNIFYNIVYGLKYDIEYLNNIILIKETKKCYRVRNPDGSTVLIKKDSIMELKEVEINNEEKK